MTTYEEWADDPFWQGWNFSRTVHEIFGMKLNTDDLIRLFQEVVKGEATITGTAADVVSDVENKDEKGMEKLGGNDAELVASIQEVHKNELRRCREFLDAVRDLNRPG